MFKCNLLAFNQSSRFRR